MLKKIVVARTASAKSIAINNKPNENKMGGKLAERKGFEPSMSF